MSQCGFFKTATHFAVLFFCLLIICPPLATYAQADADTQKLKQKVSELVKQQKYTEALPILEKLLIVEPDNAETVFYLGFALIAQANNTTDENARKALRVRARNAFIKAKELGYDDTLVDAMIQGMPADGSEGKAFSQNVEANKLMNNGEALFSQGKLGDALKSYQKALELDPKLYEAALYSGDVYTQQGDFAKAETWYQKAIAIDPQRETAYRYSATPLMRQGKYDQARDRYVEAYISEPYNRFPLSGLAQWAQATNTRLAHPQIVIPSDINADQTDDTQSDSSADASLKGKEDGSFAWIAYGATRSTWRKEKFAKTFPQEKSYRHSLAEEADALRSVLARATSDKQVKNLNPSLAKLKKLDDEGLLEAYILLARANQGIAEDHAAYLRQNRDKLRRYVINYFLIGAGSPQSAETAGDQKQPRRDEKITREYDQSKDETKLKLQMTPITCVSDACIFLSLESSFPGAKPKAEIDQALLGLFIVTKKLRPFADSTLTVLIDGESVEVGEMTFAGEVSRGEINGLAYGIILDNSTLARLAKARKLEMRLGSLALPLKEDTLNAIADFNRQARSGQ